MKPTPSIAMSTQYGPATLEGRIGRGSSSRVVAPGEFQAKLEEAAPQDSLKFKNQGTLPSAAAVTQEPRVAPSRSEVQEPRTNQDARAVSRSMSEPGQSRQIGIRKDFTRELEDRFNRRLGPENSEQRERMLQALSKIVDPETKRVTLGQISPETEAELKRLQKAAENMEANFVKQLFAEMRKGGLTKDESQTTQFAREMMDQALADSLSKTQPGLGIAQMVFTSMGERVLQRVTPEINP